MFLLKFCQNRPHGNTVSLASLPARRLVLTPPNVERASTAGTSAFSIYPEKRAVRSLPKKLLCRSRSDCFARHGFRSYSRPMKIVGKESYDFYSIYIVSIIK